ncbi:glycoside hydrolase family 25 protein [Plantibacter sp. Mn2098]|uniref:glycoside hydrolase family 25 protein n=1 Tax=Plantibacter sp. Mn2098 TaxID=3395266 RepID=UPI003BDCD2B4
MRQRRRTTAALVLGMLIASLGAQAASAHGGDASDGNGADINGTRSSEASMSEAARRQALDRESRQDRSVPARDAAASPNAIPAPPDGTVFGIDIASPQAGIDLAMFADGGGEFAIIKQGGGNADDAPYVAPRYAEQLAGARAAGLPVGHYWFNGQKLGVEAQAEFFVRTADIEPGDVIALDIESEPDTDTRPFTPAEVGRWIDVVRQSYPGVQVLLYMNRTLMNGSDWSALTDNPLWIAYWGDDDGDIGQEPAIAWWTEWTVWQFTSAARVPGFDGDVDGDLARADLFTRFGWQPPAT